MMSGGIFVCGQGDILRDDCPECGGDLNHILRGGFQAAVGRVCSLDCVDAQLERLEQQRREFHWGARDLMCACAEFCQPAGRPTEADRAEWAEYLRVTYLDST